MKKLRVNMPGGIGNQLNSYFGGLYFAHKLGLKLILDHSHANLNHHKRNFDTRIFSEIQNYSRSSLAVMILRSKLVKLFQLRFLAYLREHGHWARYKTIRALVTDFEEQSQTLPETSRQIEYELLKIYRKRRVVRLSCYFPNFSYYNQLPKTLQSLSLKTSAAFEETLRTRKEGIGLHVRLGDLLLLSQEFPSVDVPILTENYYMSCVNAAKKAMGDSPIFLFCDDYSNFLLLYPEISKICTQISPLELHPAEELVLLSKMECIITSASSFSFWAARISQNSLVFVPDVLNSKGDTYQGFPQEWVRMPASFMKF